MIYIDKSGFDSPFVNIFEREGRKFTFVNSMEEVEDSKNNIYITSGYNTFVHRCPATRNYRCCNYYVVDLVEGCPFDCTYCILQEYLNHNFIKVYSNLGRVEEEIISLSKKGVFRLGTGELSDSLAYDHILKLSDFFIPIINKLENIQFEFKTKSANVGRLFNHNPENILVSWSLNPQEIIAAEEHYTADLDERIDAAAKCAEYGYKVGFHFDPLIYYNDFEKGYSDVAKKLFEKIPEQSVEYISISTFRFIPGLLDTVREKFESSQLLKSDYVKTLDGKMRYFKSLRHYMLGYMVSRIREYWPNVFLYFCMEHETVWKQLLGFDPGEREKFESNFPFYRKSL
ncbi:SPL family radical SAM protein [Flexistipes sp.]|uniref:SPL family radical SAM protein n=1 Tax=Flexistipes sp. TaxID=3088135 RepID=UPI002E214665|nr:DNA photolyase [Flexistipes sp.]